MAIAAIAVAAWAIGCQAEKQRRKRLGAVASRLGFEFTPEYQPQLLGRLAHFDLFSQGYSKGAWNVMDGRAGDVRVQLFDHQYATDSDKPSHNFRHWAGSCVKRWLAYRRAAVLSSFFHEARQAFYDILTSHVLSWASARSSSPRHRSVTGFEEV